MSYAIEVIPDSSAAWSTNGIRFRSYEEATQYAAELASRLAVGEIRIVQFDDPVTHILVDDRVARVCAICDGLARECPACGGTGAAS